MEERFIHHHYYIPEFYNKILKDNRIDPKFNCKSWSLEQKFDYISYLKRGFPSKPIILVQETSDCYLILDGENRINLIRDFMLGGLNDYINDHTRHLLENMSIDVYISAAPIKEDDMVMLREIFHNDGNIHLKKEESTVKIITNEKKITITHKTKIPKKQINEALKTSVWTRYIGADKGTAVCYCCSLSRITQREFDTGHVIAEINGGKTHIDNLRPVCRKCNLSMGAQNMDEFKERCFSPPNYKNVDFIV